MRKPSRSIAAVLLALALASCTGTSAADLLDTAQLEEKQDNVAHARKLYGEILERHPDSPEAKIARERLAALDAA
ncbi:MAG: hypothetical protein FJ144_11380 [Deltaproteobacteria bacterium]|jgi:TolA-binding protein|nr:hypothetical protein [Deltaproteobacteria bacterium]